MKKWLLWALIAVVILAASSQIFAMRQACMAKCTAEFKGYYPDVACKYECSFFNKFKKSVKK